MTTTHYNPLDEWVERCFFSDAARKPTDLGLHGGGVRIVWLEWPEDKKAIFLERALPSERRHALTHLACQRSFLQVKELESCQVCFPPEEGPVGAKFLVQPPRVELLRQFVAGLSSGFMSSSVSGGRHLYEINPEVVAKAREYLATAPQSIKLEPDA